MQEVTSSNLKHRPLSRCPSLRWGAFFCLPFTKRDTLDGVPRYSRRRVPDLGYLQTTVANRIQRRRAQNFVVPGAIVPGAAAAERP